MFNVCFVIPLEQLCSFVIIQSIVYSRNIISYSPMELKFDIIMQSLSLNKIQVLLTYHINHGRYFAENHFSTRKSGFELTFS